MTTTTPAAALTQAFPWPRALFDPPELYALLRKENPVKRVTTAEGSLGTTMCAPSSPIRG